MTGKGDKPRPCDMDKAVIYCVHNRFKDKCEKCNKCNHEWIEQPYLLLSMPAQHVYICSICNEKKTIREGE